MWSKLVSRAIVHLGVLLEKEKGRIARKTLPAFANKPKGLVIQLPRRFKNPGRIVIGDGVRLGPDCVLSANTEYPGGSLQHPEGRHVTQTFEPTLTIGDRVSATAGLQIYALGEVTIGDDVMFAANIFICDSLHAYEDPNKPYKYQGMTDPDPIRIGRGCWIGQNVVILPGVTIGEFAIVGANSVVTRSIPPRSIAAGTPARVRKRWDGGTESWQSITDPAPGRAPAEGSARGELSVVRERSK